MRWTCPFCNHTQLAGSPNRYWSDDYLNVGHEEDQKLDLITHALGCLAPQCGKMSLAVSLHVRGVRASGNIGATKLLQSWQLIPQSSAKPQPEFIPSALREDYLEACLIRDLSPKASATLARRCIQGMIRDFAKIARGTLNAEIDALLKAVEDRTAPAAVTHESVEAIDHVRKIGNIGAHMEKDIDLIVPIGPGEAQALIELVELLFEEWYVERHQREQRLARVKTIREEKDGLIAAGKTPKPICDA